MRRGEYTPIQLSFDLGSPIHREALFQVLLTMEQEVEGPAYAGAPQKCCQQEGCCEDSAEPWDGSDVEPEPAPQDTI